MYSRVETETLDQLTGRARGISTAALNMFRIFGITFLYLSFPGLPDRTSSINGDTCPGHVRCLAAGQEHCHAGDFFSRSHAADWVLFDDRGARAFRIIDSCEVISCHRRVDRRRADAIDPDSSSRVIEG